ncbi:hypothetical protein [Nocardia brasiliensis]|uniref:hypothetical protein n=1 Tax=Nocardia brasiliensis TaxID=37326 RepID=UPI002458DD80|nr:hypothetical protein [Nocardia brasiliensis]
MTANDNDNEAPSDRPGRPSKVPLPDFTPVVDWFASPDPELQQMADLSHLMGFGVTLFLPWGTAAGNVVSVRSFYEHAAAAARASFGQYGADGAEAADQLAKTLFDDVIEDLKQSEEDPLARIHQGVNVTRFIHLADAKCFVAGQVQRRPFLRVQLRHVSAWALGTPTN